MTITCLGRLMRQAGVFGHASKNKLKFVLFSINMAFSPNDLTTLASIYIRNKSNVLELLGLFRLNISPGRSFGTKGDEQKMGAEGVVEKMLV
jgi:hypothetical protein